MVNSKKYDLQNHIIHQESPRDFYTQIPNIVYEMLECGEITGSDLILYSVYRRIAGEHGACWIGTRSLEKKCKLTDKTIARCKKSLSRSFDRLNGNSLIQIIPCDRKKERADTIIIVDVWNFNHRHFKEKYTCRNPGDTGAGKERTEEEPSNKKEQQTRKGAKAPAVVSFDKSKKEAKRKPPNPIEKTNKPKKTGMYECLEKIDVHDMHKMRVTKMYPEETVQKAIDYVLAPEFNVKTTLAKALYWACKEGLVLQEIESSTKKVDERVNKKIAMAYNGLSSNGFEVVCCPDCVRIEHRTKAPLFRYYDCDNFREEFEGLLEERGFEILG